jgi:hypothetical protein
MHGPHSQAVLAWRITAAIMAGLDMASSDPSAPKRRSARRGRSGNIVGELDEHGFVLIPDVLDDQACRRIGAAMPLPRTILGAREAGVRIRLADAAALHDLLRSPAIRALTAPVLGASAFAVRAVLFDKVPDANWQVPWHRDRAIAVREPIETAGYGPWSVKEGIHHVEPPRAVLDGMLALRLHLDDCGDEVGPLRVIPGSHRDVELGEPPATGRPSVTCAASRGSILLLRPLTLHASSPGRMPRRRRVLHIECAAADLPNGLEWRDRIAFRDS